MQQHRRGAAAVAIVAAMVIVSLVLLGAVVASAGNNDMTVRRAEGMQALYAADAGIHLAVREAIRGADEDGDGTIGSISSDNNDENDPQIGSARFTVSRSIAGTATSIVAGGRAGSSLRKADARVQGVIGGNPQTVLAAFGRAGSNSPRYSTWDGSAWGGNLAMPSIGGEAKWIRMKICPTRNETTFIAEDTAKHVTVAFFNGTSWSAVSQLSSDTGGTNDRPEDIAYEQLSSDALCVYWKGTSSRFGYRTYNGSVFAPEQSLGSPFTTECDFVTLYPRPASDDILLLAADGIAGGLLVAARWNGSAWSSWTTLVSNLETNNEECYSMAFEANSGDGLAVYAQSGQKQPRYRTWTTSGWSAQNSLPSLGAIPKWVRLAADPTSDQIVFAAQDADKDLNYNVWNGSSWGANQQLDSNLGTSDRRRFDVIFERGTGRAMLLYAHSGVKSLRYRTWNGSAWSAEQHGPNIGEYIEIIHLSRGFGDSDLFAAVSDSARDLHIMRWNGTSWSAATVLETNLSGWSQYYSFALPEPTVAPHPRLESWTEIAP
jgi:hypothetical protein